MQYITEPSREIPVTREADAVVCGGGVSGIAAAVCAARLGLNTVMIEYTSMPGGMMSHMISGLQDCKGKGGIVKEITDAFKERNISTPDITWCTKFNRYLVPYYLDELLENAGVQVLYLSSAVKPVMNEEKAEGVIIESKSGRTAIKASAVIDATGDGDIAVRGGADFVMGRPSDGGMQAISTCTDFIEYSGEQLEKDEFQKIYQPAKDKTGYSLPYDNLKIVGLPGTEHTWPCHVPHITGIDPTDTESLSKGLTAMRKQMVQIHQFMTEHLPPLKGAKLGAMSDLPGIRESRRIVCDDALTDADIYEGATCGDGLFTINQDVDIHKVTEDEPPIILKKIKPYHMRYGAMLPKGIENMLVVGRCIGGDHEALASYRVAGNCLAMGEAAAIAVHTAVSEHTTVREVDSKFVSDQMKKLGYEI